MQPSSNLMQRHMVLISRVLIPWLVLLPALWMGNGCGDSTDSDPPAGETVDGMEADVYSQINRYRRLQGLPDLEWDETIATYCRIHSMDMADGRTAFGHDGFEDRVDAIGESISVSAAAENVAYNNYGDPASVAVQSWLESPGHLANIEGDFDLTGVGVGVSNTGVYYFTQIFIRQ
ncbi:MAG: CAP domain-containing protein [Thermodesulfobacteriota bacterium]